MAALLPPVGGAGSGHRKNSYGYGELEVNFLGWPAPILKKIWRGWYKVPGGLPHLEPLLRWMVAACVVVYLC